MRVWLLDDSEVVKWGGWNGVCGGGGWKGGY